MQIHMWMIKTSIVERVNVYIFQKHNVLISDSSYYAVLECDAVKGERRAINFLL